MRAAAIFHPRADRGLLQRFPGAEFAEEIAEGCPAALIFGGDGTIHRHLRRLVESAIPALVVPTGSGNDFAHALGLHSIADAERAWQGFMENGGKVRAIDVARIQWSDGRQPKADSLFCNIAGVGLDSEVNRRANALPAWLRGRGGYILALAPALVRFRAPRLSVEVVDGTTGEVRLRIGERAMLCAFANAPAYGDGMRIAPRAKLDDGFLEVCFVRRTGKLRLLRLFPRVFSGRHLDLSEIEYLRAARVRVESDPPLEIFADGEFAGRTPAEITVRKKALRVIVGSEV